MTDGLSVDVGELKGRVSALEGRMDRHEISVWRRLDIISDKLDIVIRNSDEHSGEKLGVTKLYQWIVRIVSVVIPAAVTAWATLHLGGHH